MLMVIKKDPNTHPTGYISARIVQSLKELFVIVKGTSTELQENSHKLHLVKTVNVVI